MGVIKKQVGSTEDPRRCTEMFEQPALRMAANAAVMDRGSPSKTYEAEQDCQDSGTLQGCGKGWRTAMAFLYSASDSAWLRFGHPADSHWM